MRPGRVRVEFTIEPWDDAGHPVYVQAAISRVRASGLPVDLGPFGTGVEGPPGELIRIIPDMLEAALAAGADRVSLQLTRLDTGA